MPTMLSYGAYRSTVYKEPPREKTPGEIQIFKKIAPFLEKIGIRKDLQIKETNTLHLAETAGTNFFTQADAAIHVTKNFYQTNPAAFFFVFKHEISHLKNNDRCTAFVLAFIATLVAFAFTSSYDESLSTDVVPFTGAAVLFSSIYCQELQADNFAIAHSSIAELKGARRLFQAIQQMYVEYREKSGWGKCFISPEGENLLDFMHPPLASRIKKIESALKAKNAIIHEESEQKKTEKLKRFFKAYK